MLCCPRAATTLIYCVPLLTPLHHSSSHHPTLLLYWLAWVLWCGRVCGCVCVRGGYEGSCKSNGLVDFCRLCPTVSGFSLFKLNHDTAAVYTPMISIFTAVEIICSPHSEFIRLRHFDFRSDHLSQPWHPLRSMPKTCRLCLGVTDWDLSNTTCSV